MSYSRHSSRRALSAEIKYLKSELAAWKSVAKAQADFIEACKEHIAFLNKVNELREHINHMASAGSSSRHTDNNAVRQNDFYVKGTAESLKLRELDLMCILATVDFDDD